MTINFALYAHFLVFNPPVLIFGGISDASGNEYSLFLCICVVHFYYLFIESHCIFNNSLKLARSHLKNKITRFISPSAIISLSLIYYYCYILYYLEISSIISFFHLPSQIFLFFALENDLIISA